MCALHSIPHSNSYFAYTFISICTSITISILPTILISTLHASCPLSHIILIHNNTYHSSLITHNLTLCRWLRINVWTVTRLFSWLRRHAQLVPYGIRCGTSLQSFLSSLPLHYHALPCVNFLRYFYMTPIYSFFFSFLLLSSLLLFSFIFYLFSFFSSLLYSQLHMRGSQWE